MTRAFDGEWELGWQGEEEAEYKPPPNNSLKATMPITRGGRAEIKPHNAKGWREGLKQLQKVKNPQGLHRVLITYRPMSGADPATAGWPSSVQVFATEVTPTTTTKDLATQQWWQIDSFTPVKQVPLTLDNPGTFGSLIEHFVRNHFRDKVLTVVTPARTMRSGTGGSRPGSDVIWHELADFYAELAAELSSWVPGPDAGAARGR